MAQPNCPPATRTLHSSSSCPY